ncbi:hypothetical protein KM043_003642 [Ampulex compressa]|nr:hypothetical protein KM043_003642 [Ampulex compressa]
MASAETASEMSAVRWGVWIIEIADITVRESRMWLFLAKTSATGMKVVAKGSDSGVARRDIKNGERQTNGISHRANSSRLDTSKISGMSRGEAATPEEMSLRAEMSGEGALTTNGALITRRARLREIKLLAVASPEPEPWKSNCEFVVLEE